MRAGLDPWHFICPSCGYEFSTLTPSIQSAESKLAIDESEREAGLKILRERNFKILIERLAQCGLPQGAKVLDVGCAHGWFLLALSRNGYKATGIEPDREIAQIAKSTSQNVYEGFFPDDLPASERFDAITFHDVFEHLPNVDAIMQHCFARLDSGGLLLINAPCKEGIFFRIAKLLRILGIRGAWDRLWQKGLPSPHLSYFNAQSLRKLAQRNNFSEVSRFEIAAENAKGSWQRIRYTGMSFPAATMIWLGLMVARPFLKFFASDAAVFVFQKQTRTLWANAPAISTSD